MKKRILGITALLAVLAMCLTFPACPGMLENNDPVFVTFTNNINDGVTISFKGLPPLRLERGTMLKGTSEVVEGKGKIVLQTIVFDNPLINDDLNCIEVSGQLIQGQKTGKDVPGLSLAGGTCIFNPNQAYAGNPAAWKISVLP